MSYRTLLKFPILGWMWQFCTSRYLQPRRQSNERGQKEIKKESCLQICFILYFQNQIPVVNLYRARYYSGKIQESLQNWIAVSTTISESIEDKH